MPRFNYRPEEEAEMHFIYGLCDDNASEAAREYRRHYPDRRTPNPHTFINLHRRFREQGLKKTPHERDINLTVQDEDGIMNAIIEDPTLSTRRVGQIYNVNHDKVWRVWKRYGLHPYHYRKVQGLLPHDNFSRIAFCQRMNALLTEDQQLIGKILWMDEAQFTRAEHQRGPTLQLVFSIMLAYDKDNELYSKTFTISNLAIVKFKFRFDRGRCDTITSFSAKKIDAANDHSTKVNVTWDTENTTGNFKKFSKQSSKQPSKQLICMNDWSVWIVLDGGKPHFKANLESQIGLFMINVRIWASKTKELKLYEKVHEDADFTDFHLTAPDGSVAVHRVILAVHSITFRAMLKGDWKETVEDSIVIKGVTRQTLQNLKDYMYMGTLPDNDWCPLLLIAKCYLIHDLRTACIQKLTETVTKENLYELLEFACDNRIPELSFAILHSTPDFIVNTVYREKTEINEPDDQKKPILASLTEKAT